VRQFGLRLLQLIPVMILVTLATFFMTTLLPGDPAIAILGENARPAQIAAVHKELRLDEPIASRYIHWVGAALKGDLGRSIISNQPVADALREKLPVNLELALLAQALAVLLAVPIGAWSAYRAGRAFDRSASAVSFGIVSVPPFLLGLLLVALLAIHFQIFPNTGWYKLSEGIGKNLKYLVLPVLTLALGEAAVYGQLLRADMAATLQEDYVLAARARGLPNRHVLMREALRPSSFSFVTLAGVNLGRLIGGTVVVEQIFGLPGVGRAITQAIPPQDFPTLQGGVLVLASVYLLINLAVDMSYAFLDPRVRRVTR
jgi:peptide/nickel transport system permease protein